MKLATLKQGGRDGTLVVVSRDLSRCQIVPGIAHTLQAALDNWDVIAPRLAPRQSAGSQKTIGVDMLAVFSPAQAEQLVALSLGCPILVLMRKGELTRQDPLYRQAVTGQLHLTIHDLEQIAELEHAGRMLGCRLLVHLYLDTGMSRSGLNSEQLVAVLKDLPNLRHIQLVGIYTHFASAESDKAFTDEQAARLDRILAANRDKLPKDLLVHVANTAATLRSPRYHRGMVRVGLGLYGYRVEGLEPSPSGRGQGEGTSEFSGSRLPSRSVSEGLGSQNTTRKTRTSPHPNPLPKGEGVRSPLKLSND